MNMAVVLEKAQEKKQQNDEITRIWDQDVDPMTQGAIDRVLDFMIAQNVSPNIKMQGDLVQCMSEMVTILLGAMPAHLQEDTKVLCDHLIVWVCDYAEETGLKNLNVTLSFKRQDGSERESA